MKEAKTMKKDFDLLLFKSLMVIDKEKAFKYIYEQYNPLCYFIASSYLTNKEDINDVIQQSFINLFNNFSNVDNIKSYLCKTVKNIAFNTIKKESKTINYDKFINLGDEDSKIKGSIAYQELLKSMQNILGEDDTKIIILYLIYGYDFKKIAEIFKSNSKTIKTKYYRALKKYQKEMKK